jgi:F-box/WD-40 domain protein MET30
MVSGGTDHTIRVWNFLKGECYTLTGHMEWVNSVRLCEQDRLVVSGSDDSTVRLWDLQTRSCIREFKGHVGQVQIALPSPKGFTHRLLGKEMAIDTTQRRSNEFRPGCETTTTTTTTTTRKPKDDKSTKASPTQLSNTPLLLTGSLDNTVKLWDMDSGSCVRTLFGHVEGVWGLAYDTLRVVSGSHDKTIRVWDMDSGRCMHALEGHNGPVTAIALSDTKIISCSDDGDVRIWDYGVH